MVKYITIIRRICGGDAAVEKTISKKDVDQIVFSVIAILLTGIMIFEVPKLVFWSPMLLFLLFIVYRLYHRESFMLSVSAAILFIFMVAYVYFTYNPNSSIYYQTYIFLHNMFFFIIGCNFFLTDKPLETLEKQYRILFLCISLLYICYVFITFFNALKNPSAELENRNYWSIWYPGRVKKTATGFSASMLFAVAWGANTLFYSKKGLLKIIGAALIVICFAFNLYTQTRLLVYLTPVILFLQFFTWLVFYKKKFKIGIAILIGFAAAIVLTLIIYAIFKDELKARFENTVLSRFFELGLRSARWRYMKNVLQNFSWTYLGGGYSSATYGTPHNMWLYIYDRGGIIPFLIYCVFTLIALVYYILFLFNKKVSLSVKVIVSTFLFCVFVEFMLEDLLYGLPSFVVISHFVLGSFFGLAYYGKGKSKKITETT